MRHICPNFYMLFVLLWIYVQSITLVYDWFDSNIWFSIFFSNASKKLLQRIKVGSTLWGDAFSTKPLIKIWEILFWEINFQLTLDCLNCILKILIGLKVEKLIVFLEYWVDWWIWFAAVDEVGNPQVVKILQHHETCTFCQSLRS